MLSRVFNTTFSGLFRAQPNTISNQFTFCTSTGQRHESHPLRNKIMGLSSFDEFTSFFREKNKQFDPSCYSMASRTLAKILIESRLVFNYNHRQALKAYLTSLQKVDIEALNLQQFSQLLYLLRIIKLDPVNNNSFVRQFIKAILMRSQGKLKELETQTSINRLSYFYQEYSSLGGKQATVLARKINQALRNNVPDVQTQILSVNQISLILKGMRNKKLLSGEEIVLLRNIVRTVTQKYFDKLSFFELAQISVGINQINSANVNDSIPISWMDQIHKKILQSLDEMDEKSIMYILNGQKTNNRVYNQIYRVIFDKILDEIQPNGESSFNELFTLKLFNGISNKVRLQSTTPENQQKFFAFFKQAITKTPRFIHSFVETYVEKSFFNYKHLLRVQEILESIPDFNFKLTLLHAMSKKKLDIQKITNIDMAKDIEIKEKNLIMMIFIVENILQHDVGDKEKQYAEFLEKLKARFFDLYKVEDDTFSRLLFNLPPDLVETLSRGLKRQIEARLPNPLETEQPEKYRIAWLKFQIFGTSQQTYAKRYANTLKDKLTLTDLSKLVRIFINQGYSNPDSISNLLNLISKKIQFLSQDDTLVNDVTRLMQVEISSIFESGASQTIKNKYWHILNESFEKLQPTKFFMHFSSIINVVLKSVTYDFMYSSQYQSFLTKILHKAEYIRNRNVVSDLLDECLKLNLIKRGDIPNLSANLKENLSKNQTLMLKMIETNEFFMEGVELDRNNLHLFLFNISLQTNEFLVKNRTKLMEIIGEMKVRDVWRCLTHYRLGSRKQEAEIVDTLFKQINKYKVRFQESSAIFIAEVMRRNNFDKGYAKIDNVKIFFKNALEYFTDKRNIHKIPLEDHVELLRSANDFKIRNDDYVHGLFSWFHSDANIFKRELYVVAGNLGVTLTKKEMDRLFEHNFFAGFNSSFSKCFNIFLLNEKNIPTPGTYLTSLIARHNELSAKDKVPIFSLYYEYLRKTYPEETKDWQPNHIEKADFCRNLESLNLKSINLLRQVMEEATQEKWVENMVSNNYYYTFRNVAIVFPYQSKYHGENILLKRILTSLTGIEKIIVINRKQSGLKSALKFIMQNDEKLISAGQEADIMKKIDHKYEQNRVALAEQEVEEVPQVPQVAEVEQAKQAQQPKQGQQAKN